MVLLSVWLYRWDHRLHGTGCCRLRWAAPLPPFATPVLGSAALQPGLAANSPPSHHPLSSRKRRSQQQCRNFSILAPNSMLMVYPHPRPSWRQRAWGSRQLPLTLAPLPAISCRVVGCYEVDIRGGARSLAAAVPLNLCVWHPLCPLLCCTVALEP